VKHEKLVLPNNPVLRKRCVEIPKNTDVSQIVKEMFEVLDSTASGVGLAAPQVGQSLRMFITRYQGNDRVFINPKIHHKLGGLKEEFESCLSLPNIVIPVKRHSGVLIEYYDQSWVRHKEVFRDFEARIIQHEQDHLNGKLIVDYGKPVA
jgi:peptide deformylase